MPVVGSVLKSVKLWKYLTVEIGTIVGASNYVSGIFPQILSSTLVMNDLRVERKNFKPENFPELQNFPEISRPIEE